MVKTSSINREEFTTKEYWNCHVCGFTVEGLAEENFDQAGIKHATVKQCLEMILTNNPTRNEMRQRKYE